MAFFTAAGRLRRRGYFFRVLGLYALAVVIYAIPGFLYKAEVPAILAITASLGLLGVFYLLTIQVLLRLHDLNMQAWWVLVAFVPGLSYVLGAGLQFVRGTSGPNRFGPDLKRPKPLPPPATSNSLTPLAS